MQTEQIHIEGAVLGVGMIGKSELKGVKQKGVKNMGHIESEAKSDVLQSISVELSRFGLNLKKLGRKNV